MQSSSWSGAALHRKEAGCGDGGGHVRQLWPPVCELQERADCGIFNTQGNLALVFLLLWNWIFIELIIQDCQ